MARAAQYPIPLDDLGNNFTTEEREKILAFVSENRNCTPREIAEMLPGRRRSEIRALLQKDEAFAAEVRHARGYGDEAIREAIKTRAIDGWDEPVFHGGEQVGTVRRYSDPLLKSLASAYLEEYKDVRRLELTGADGGPVRVEHKGTDAETLLQILQDAGAFEEVHDGEVVEDAETVGELPSAGEVLPARPARQSEASGLPLLP